MGNIIKYKDSTEFRKLYINNLDSALDRIDIVRKKIPTAHLFVYNKDRALINNIKNKLSETKKLIRELQKRILRD